MSRSLRPVLIEERYLVLSEVGRDASGVVYLAHDASLDRQVRVKMVASERFSPRLALRIRDEARALARIHSQNVVSVYAFGEHKGAMYFVTEHVEGRTLEDLLREHRARAAPLPPTIAVQIASSIAEGLEAVHKVGLVHGDVRPGTIVIEQNSGRPVLVELGLARPESAGPYAGGIAGCAAPEQAGLFPERVTIRADVYALGCVIFEMLTGRAPFLGESADDVLKAQLRDARPKISHLHPELDLLDGVVDCALAPVPTDRFATPRALVAAAAQALTRLESRRARQLMTPGRPSDPAARGADSPPVLLIFVIDAVSEALAQLRHAIRIALFGRPTRVIEFSSWGPAMAEARVALPDLVVAGYDDDCDAALDACATFRSGPTPAHVIAVASSAQLARTAPPLAMLGIHDFVTKPADLNTLVEALGSVADRAGWLPTGRAASGVEGDLEDDDPPMGNET